MLWRLSFLVGIFSEISSSTDSIFKLRFEEEDSSLYFFFVSLLFKYVQQQISNTDYIQFINCNLSSILLSPTMKLINLPRFQKYYQREMSLI